MNTIFKVTILCAMTLVAADGFGACREIPLNRTDRVFGTLSASDCKISDLVGGRDTSKVDVFTHKVVKAESIAIRLSSRQFDPLLYIYNEDYSRLVVAEDNSGDNKNVNIKRLILMPGTYKLLVNSSSNSARHGIYDLRTSEPTYSGDVANPKFHQ
jgi:hypothetical protein